MILFETDYSKINTDKIRSVKQANASLQFEDDANFYKFNYSKNTLYRKFVIPSNAFKLPIEIIEDPFALLLDLLDYKTFRPAAGKLIKGVNFVILPLFGYKNKQKFVFQKSSLNQWNASGRVRNPGEVYIPIPKNIHKQFPDFFPGRDEEFTLQVPTGDVLTAKVCQDNSKALMTKPNKALSDWLLRKVLQLEEGELATIEKLNALGFDSVIIYKENAGKFRIDIAKLESYNEFINIEEEL